jgi:hypothetical protein
MAFGKILRGAYERIAGEKTEKHPDRREPGELMRRADVIGWELSALVTSAFPERAQAEQERALVEEALRRPIVEAGPIGKGVSGALAARFEDGSKAVYKPRSRETAIREGVRPGTFAMREWLGAQIDRATGLDVVPATILRDGPEGMGSMQEWKEGKSPTSDLSFMIAWEKQAKPEALARLTAYDRLTGQTDRKGDNFLVEEDGDLDAIDNSLMYSRSTFVNLMSKGMNIAEIAYRRRKGEVGPEAKREILRGLERLNGATDVLDRLRDAFLLALDEKDGAAAWKEFTAALDEICRKKDV